jgi:transposase
MANERLSMRKTREILRLKWELGRSHREVAASLGVGVGTVSMALERARAAGLGLGWETVKLLGEEELDRRLYRRGEVICGDRAQADFVYLHTELRRPGVTLQLLHHEYLERHPDGYRYSQYCERYRQWVKKQRRSMRQVHRGGEKMFVDYAGQHPKVIGAGTGEVREAELFVAVLGASNYTYAEATWSQTSPEWIGSHVRALEYIGGVPGAVVPDQLRSGVSAPCRYEPGIQRTYEELAEHYGTVILPARPASPRDKAKAEVGVQVAERWILARLRNQRFFSLEELNLRIGELLEELNGRVMRTYGVSRRDLFERLDRPALKPLPDRRFVYGEWKTARVSIDYHLEVERHYYSVPHGLVGEKLDVRVTATTVEVFQGSVRVASHARSYRQNAHTTVAEHMPKAHREHLEWSPSRFLRWAETIGPKARALVEAILADRPHPEQGYRSCLGILRLSKRYSRERIEAACARALGVGARSYRHVDSILKHGLDRLPNGEAATEQELREVIVHENLRGGRYYH